VDSIEAVLFDFGGVFTSSPFDAADAVEARSGAAPGRIRELVFGPYHEDTDHPWHRLERGELSFGDAREQIVALGEREGLDTDPFRLFRQMARGSGGTAREPFVERTRALREAGYRTALVTNNAREFRDQWRRLLPVDELFEVVIDSSEVGVRKPDPVIFRLALERLGDLAPERALFLDDYSGNIEAAQRIGIRGVLVASDPSDALAALDTLLRARS